MRLAGSEEGGRVYTEHDPESKMEIPITRFQSMSAHNGGRSRRDFFYLAGTIAVGTTCEQNRVKAVEPETRRSASCSPPRSPRGRSKRDWMRLEPVGSPVCR